MNIKDQTVQQKIENTPSGLPPDHGAGFDGESDSRIDELSAMIPSAFAIFSLEAEGKIRSLYVSPQGNAIFGGTHEDYIKNYQGRILPEWPFSLNESGDSKFSGTAMFELLQGKAIEVTVPAVRVDGRKMWLRAFCRMKSGENKQIVYANFLDITDQISREEIEKQTNERYRMLACTAGSYVFDYNIPSNELTCTCRNQQDQLTDTVIRAGMDELLHSGRWIDPASAALCEAQFKRARIRSCEGEFEFKSSDHAEGLQKACWYSVHYSSAADHSGHVFRIVGRVENIQRHKDQENERYEREHAFRMTLNSSAVLSLCFDTYTGERIATDEDICPPAISENINLPDLFMFFQMIVHLEDLDEVKAFESSGSVQGAAQKPACLILKEWRMRSLNSPEQGYRWKQFSFVSVRNPLTGHFNLYVMASDIQDRKLRETGSLPEEAGPRTGGSGHVVRIRTFGYFDVFVDGKAVPFRHAKAKELLALLVDRRGGTLNSSEAITFLWENESANKRTQARYRKTAMLLKETLEAYGISDIMENIKGVRRIVPDKVECDLYHYLSGGDEAPLYYGHYLLNYSWGETTALILQKSLDEKEYA